MNKMASQLKITSVWCFLKWVGLVWILLLASRLTQPSIKLCKILLLRALLISLAFTWNSAYADADADPTSDCIRFSAVKEWSVDFTLQGDLEGSDGDTKISEHQTLTASSFILDTKVKPASCPGDILFRATSPSVENIKAVYHHKRTEPDYIGLGLTHRNCFNIKSIDSLPSPVSLGEPAELVLQFSAGTYRLKFPVGVPATYIDEGGCVIEYSKNVLSALPMGLWDENGGLPIIDKMALPASGLVLKGQKQFTYNSFGLVFLGLPVNWTLTWNIVPKDSQEPKKKKETIPRACKQSGSIIGCENQSLGEVINVAGTAFSLHYQSDRATGRNLVNPVAVTHAQTFDGWTLSVHHRYDPATNELYLGDGDHRDTTDLGTVKPSAAGGFWIASEDGSVVYEFASDGQHLKTLHGLTGTPLLSFSYDAKGRLIDIVDGSGNHTAIQRDANGHPTSIVSPYGQTTQLTTDANGYLASITHPSGAVDKFTTTPKGLLSSYTNPRQNTATFAYDEQGRLISDTNADGGKQTLTRSETASAFNVTLRTAEGRTTQYQTTPADSGGEARIITNAAGLKTQSSRAADGTQTATLPDGTQTAQTVEPDPRFGKSAAVIKNSSITMPSGLKLDGTATRNVTLTDPANPFTLSELTDTVSINGRTYSSTYNGASRSLQVKTPTGRIGQMTIDPQGRVVNQTMPELNPTAYTYDAKGQLSTVAQGERTLQFNYGSAGYLERVTDPLGRTASYAYDVAGRVTKQTLPDGREIAYTYDANGNLTSLTPPGRSGHLFSYTAGDQTAKYEPPLVAGTGNTLYEYNLDKALTKITRPDGQMLNFSYDASKGRLTDLTLPTGKISYAYDATTGKLTGITAPDGGTLAYTYNGALLTKTAWTGVIAGNVDRSYDNDFRVTSLSVNGANPVAYQYDADSLLTKAGDLTLTRNTQNGLLTATTLGSLTDAYSYDGFAAVTAYEAKYGASNLLRFEYDHDKLGRITQKRQLQGGVTHAFDYGYDTAGRLIEVKLDGVVTVSYGYDTNGNRTHLNGAEVAHYDNQDRLLDYQGATYQYTANGELQQKTVAGQMTQYGYDVLGNLRKVNFPNSTVIDYLIDGQNRRIGKKRNGSLEQAFLYQGQLQPIAELDGTGAIVSRFIYATGINVPDYMVKGGVTYRIIKDHLGSPRLVVDVATNTVAQQMDYDAFGNVTLDSNPGFQPFGFAGGLYDRDTKLVRFGARDYEAETGRWTVKDPIGFGGGFNFYNYVINDPINLNDSIGLWSLGISGYAIAGGGISVSYTSEDGLSIGYEVGIGIGFSIEFDPDGKPFVDNPLRYGDGEASIYAEAQGRIGSVRGTCGVQSTFDEKGDLGSVKFKPKSCIGPACFSEKGVTLRANPKDLKKIFEYGAKLQAKAGIRGQFSVYHNGELVY